MVSFGRKIKTTQFKDLRLSKSRALNPKSKQLSPLLFFLFFLPAHYTQQKNISTLQKEKPFVVKDMLTSQVELFDTLSKVYSLFMTLKNNSHLKEFSFILRWNSLSKEEQKEKYSEYACHELNYYLFRKDPNFFSTIITPFLKSKKEKTFLDHYLLGNPLDSFSSSYNFEMMNEFEKLLLGERLDETIVFSFSFFLNSLLFFISGTIYK